MATNFLVHEKIWFDKFKYDDAERKFYEQMNGPVAGTLCQVGAALEATEWLCQSQEAGDMVGTSGPAPGAGGGSSGGGGLGWLCSCPAQDSALCCVCLPGGRDGMHTGANPASA